MRGGRETGRPVLLRRPSWRKVAHRPSAKDAGSEGGYTKGEQPLVGDGSVGSGSLDEGPEGANPEGSADISNADYHEAPPPRR
jgi:hypothetical protein